MAPADPPAAGGGVRDPGDVRRARFPVMGGTAVVTVVGGHAHHLNAAEARLRDLDALWSRFRSGSDVSRLNAAEGAPRRVAPETLLLLTCLVEAWRVTDGAFDPTLLPALVAAGDVTSRLDGDARTRLPASARWPGDPAGITLDHSHGTARLPHGTAIDAGGLGKGLAADLVATELVDDGADGALVSVGGDLRATGRGPDGGWSVAVEPPGTLARHLGVLDLAGGGSPGVVDLADGGLSVAVEPPGTPARHLAVHDPADDGSPVASERPGAPDRYLAVLDLADGGVATSTPAARRWHHQGAHRHHLLDPVTGAPSAQGVASVTVAAGTAAWAEALTKVPYALGPHAGAAALDAAGAAALILTDDGTTLTAGAWHALARIEAS